jgi:hypothetical protein
MPVEYLLQEDGAKLVAEDDSGFLVLQTSVAPLMLPFGDSSFRSELSDVRSVFAGGSLYSFSFDSTLTAYGLTGLWASNPFVAYHSTTETGLTITADNGYIATADSSALLIPWREADTRGLRPQFRFLIGLSSTAANGTVNAQVVTLATDLGGTEPGPILAELDPPTNPAVNAVTSTDVSVTPSTPVPQLRDSGWHDLDAGYTVYDFFRVGFRVRKVGGSGQVSDLTTPTVLVRWVVA